MHLRHTLSLKKCCTFISNSMGAMTLEWLVRICTTNFVYFLHQKSKSQRSRTWISTWHESRYVCVGRRLQKGTKEWKTHFIYLNATMYDSAYKYAAMFIYTAGTTVTISHFSVLFIFSSHVLVKWDFIANLIKTGSQICVATHNDITKETYQTW